jgi:hypothetical protein
MADALPPTIFFILGEKIFTGKNALKSPPQRTFHFPRVINLSFKGLKPGLILPMIFYYSLYSEVSRQYPVEDCIVEKTPTHVLLSHCYTHD